MKTPIRFLLLTCSVAVAAACGDNRPAPAANAPRSIARSSSSASVGDAGVADTAAPYVYSYNPMGKRDPFRSPVAEVQLTERGGGVCNEPLCQWDLDQLSLVAVVTGDANPIAMVQDPQTRGYIIRRGTKMGKQGGQVTQILRDSVTVTEYFQSPDGKRNPNPVQMHLKSEQQQVPEMDFLTGKNIE